MSPQQTSHVLIHNQHCWCPAHSGGIISPHGDHFRCHGVHEPAEEGKHLAHHAKCFGNSTGDSSMAEYVTSGNPYRSLAFMLCCDDTERENGSQSKADKMLALCEQYDWVPVSMKNDWTTIYGDGVTYLGAEAANAA